MTKKYFLLALFCCLSVAVLSTAWSKPLSDAESFSDIAAYISQERNKLNAEGLGPKEYAVALGEILFAAGDRLLEIGQNDMQIRSAYNLKVTALQQQVDVGIEGVDEKLDALLAEWLRSEDPHAQWIAQRHRFTQFSNAANRAEISPESFAKFKADLKDWLNRRETTVSNLVELGLRVAQRNAVPAEQFMAELVEHVQSPQFPATNDTERERMARSLEGILRLAIGSDPKLYGRTLDDEEFVWENLREEGKEKYVLLNFTATWCGPCQMELPGLLDAYKKYADKGLEIISIHVWERGEDPVETVRNYVEEKKIPWIVISEELSKQAGHPAYQESYNLSGVPTVVLVDKEGKVILGGMQARGPQLPAKLEEIFR